MTGGLGRVRAQEESGDPKRHLRRLLALGSGAAAFAVVFLLRRYGILGGVAALVYASLLACLIPWSACFSRRLLLSGALFLGWIPLLWWVKLPVPQVDRVGTVLAAASAGLVCWVLWGAGVRERSKRLVPRFAVVDAMPFAAAGLTTFLTWPLISARDGVRMLGLFMERGYDHVSHFSMVFHARADGGLVTALGAAPDGSQWIGANYPQHLHGVVTAITDLYNGTALGDAAREVLLYGRSLALLQILMAILLAAGVAQLTGLKKHPLLAWPIAGILVGAFTVGPGASALSAGYPNFIFACATAGLAVLLAVPMRRELAPLRVFALGGLVVATVHGWALVGPAAAIAACVALVPLGRARWPRSGSRWIGLAAAFLAAAAASLAVIPFLISSGGLGIMVVGREYLPWTLLDIASTALFAGGAATAIALALSVRRRTAESVGKGISLAVVPLAVLALTLAIAVYQLRTAGTFSYYVHKMLQAVPLVSAAVLVAALALHAEAPDPVRGRIRKSVAVVVTMVGTAATLCVFGLGGLGYYSKDVSDLLASSQARGEAERVLAATDVAERRPFGTTFYVAGLADDPLPFFAEQWQRSLSMMWTGVAADRGWILLDAVRKNGRMEIDEVARMTRALLEEGPELAVTVAPQLVDPVRALLPAELRARVITWESP